MNWFEQITDIRKVLDQVIHESFRIKKSETLLIEFMDVPEEITKLIISHCIKNEIQVLYNAKFQEILLNAANTFSSEYYKMLADLETAQMKKAGYFLGIRAIQNSFDLGDMNIENKSKVLKHFIQPVHYEYRNKNIPWLYFRLPTSGMAQQSGMDTKSFTRYYYDTLLIDYHELKTKFEPLRKKVFETKKVFIENADTKLEFEIENMPAIIDAGEHNLPDGEVRTVPVKRSINGSIRFNIPTTYYGVHYNFIELTFSDGKVIKALSDKNREKLNEILNMDEGSRYVGEFAIGINPLITHPINDILFDEKIHGSIHLALGNAISTCDNGNRSAIHWDLILDLNKNKGGGKIYMDDTLVYDSGVFYLKRDNNH